MIRKSFRETRPTVIVVLVPEHAAPDELCNVPIRLLVEPGMRRVSWKLQGDKTRFAEAVGKFVWSTTSLDIVVRKHRRRRRDRLDARREQRCSSSSKDDHLAATWDFSVLLRWQWQSYCFCHRQKLLTIRRRDRTRLSWNLRRQRLRRDRSSTYLLIARRIECGSGTDAERFSESPLLNQVFLTYRLYQKHLQQILTTDSFASMKPLLVMKISINNNTNYSCVLIGNSINR